MGNSIAYFSIIVWPIIVFMFISRLGIIKGIFLVLILSYLILPASFEIDLPAIPAFDKTTITSISIFLYLLFKGKKFNVKEFTVLEKIMLLVIIIAPFLTSLTNAERFLHLPGITLYDGLSDTVRNILVFLPFLFGFKYFRSKESHVIVLRYFVIVVLFYSILILYEIRMSPQLHTMLYGFFPHSFAQQARAGGFRAVVFLGHGLLIALLVSVAFMISTVLWRSKIKISKFYNINSIVVLFLFIVLILSKSYGALIIGIFGFIILRFFSNKIIFFISYSLVALYLIYPIMNAANIFPHQQIVNVVSSINEDRADSLDFRFFHEKQLLEHANDKKMFGWGGWGRNRVYDPETFRDLSVTDGRWIIILGTKGWVGYIAELFFIAFSIVYASRAVKILKGARENKDEAFLLSAHALILSLILVDQIPNASFNYFYWFFVGILYGRSYDVISKFKDNANKSNMLRG